MAAISTEFARANQAKAQAGQEVLKTVARMCFGSGGVDGQGNPVTPLTSDAALGNKLLSVPIDSISFPTPTTARYTGRIPIDQLNGMSISEVGLEDAGQNLLTRKTFRAQPKTDENEFVFEWDEIF